MTASTLAPALAPIFQPDQAAPPRALLVAGACGNVGLGKLGQFARLLVPKGIPVIALDPSPKVLDVKAALAKGYGDRVPNVEAILAGVHVVQGGVEDVPAALRLGFVFEAIPERIDLKHRFYRAVRARDPEAFIASATSGITTQILFGELEGKERCCVLHPFFPHLTNKLFELPTRDATTGASELKLLHKLLGALGLAVIPTRDVPGFAADRLFCGMMLEAVRIHADTGLSPAQIDAVTKDLLGTQPFFVHNLIPGANYLSAHTMELMAREVDSTLYAIPEVWRAYVDDPTKQWPYARGEQPPAELVPVVRERMLGMLFALTARMAAHEVAGLDAINFLAENALAFAAGPPAMIQALGFAEARAIVERFIATQNITHAEAVAPLAALAADAPGWGRIYTDVAVHDGVGLISLKRTTLNHGLIAELDAAYEALQANPEVQAIVLAPDGTYSREFGHGAHIADFVPVLGDETAARALVDGWKRVTAKLRQGKPTVAALVGRVLGGSLELAASCHERIAAAGATTINFPETTVGVLPGLGGCHLVHRAVRDEALPALHAMLLAGRGTTAEDAATWGFVRELVPVKELPAASLALARGLGRGELAPSPFRSGPATVAIDLAAIPSTSEHGVALDAELRALLVATIAAANAAALTEGAAIESAAAAKSLTLSSSAIGVKAALRGKPPEFMHKLG
jgi:enoyl-CoA hydratase/3-hydroxyacyl-CoA dehydrogenase